MKMLQSALLFALAARGLLQLATKLAHPVQTILHSVQNHLTLISGAS